PARGVSHLVIGGPRSTAPCHFSRYSSVSSRSRAAHRALSRFRPLYTAACRKPPSNDSPRRWASVRGGSEEMGRSFALAFWRGKEGLMSPHAGRARRSAAFGRACPTALG